MFAMIDLSFILEILTAISDTMLIVAVLRLLRIDATLTQILKAIKKADENRREEFNASCPEE